MRKTHSPILSFIVPVYNVAPYLRKCVDSLIHQDYDDYEIILVDDGSTDDSGAICDEYALKSQKSKVKSQEYPLIKVIHQKNRGLSVARNAGIAAATGEYICFVDSDDYWKENVLGGLMAQIEQDKLDVLRYDYQNVNERYEVFEPNKTPRYIDTKNEVVDGETYLNTRMGYACYAVMFILRRDLIISDGISNPSNNVLFTEGIHFEDTEWLPRMMLAAKRINSTTTTVYNYLVRQGSITKTQGNRAKTHKNLEDKLLIIDKYRQYIEQYPECKWLINMQSNMVVGVLTTVAREFYAERRKYIKRLREINVFPVSIADQGHTYIRRARIVKVLGPRIYCAIMHLR